MTIKLRTQRAERTEHNGISQRLISLSNAVGEEPVKELALLFKESMPNELRMLHLLFKSKDFKKMKFTAHKLKSVAANIGAVKMATLFEFIENSTLNTSPDKIYSHLHFLDDEFSFAMNEINEFLQTPEV